MEFESTNQCLVSERDNGECDVLGMVEFGCRLIILWFFKKNASKDASVWRGLNRPK